MKPDDEASGAVVVTGEVLAVGVDGAAAATVVFIVVAGAWGAGEEAVAEPEASGVEAAGVAADIALV